MLRERGRENVDELVKKGVIVPANETTDWGSPAFFVPKGDKIRVRLVTDYTELNKHVKRPIHPFSSTRRYYRQSQRKPKYSPSSTQYMDTSSSG